MGKISVAIRLYTNDDALQGWTELLFACKTKRNHRDDPCGSTMDDYSIIALPPAIPFTSFHDEGGFAP
jgi:hypothetical protein